MRKFLILALALLLLMGCELFDLRESQPPSAPAPWHDFATDWMLCFQNLTYCYTDSRNVVKYGGIFTQDYRFSFAVQDAVENNITQIWGRSQEQDMLINLHNQSTKISLTLTPITTSPDEILANEVRLYRQYYVNVTSASKSTGYGGNMELQIRRVGGYWYIYKWLDYRNGTLPTWGMLKHGYAQ